MWTLLNLMGDAASFSQPLVAVLEQHCPDSIGNTVDAGNIWHFVGSQWHYTSLDGSFFLYVGVPGFASTSATVIPVWRFS